jgi:Ketopantoate reductase PanE/ApbA C terminal
VRSKGGRSDFGYCRLGKGRRWRKGAYGGEANHEGLPQEKWTLVHTLFRGTLEEAEAVARAGGIELPEDFIEQALATAAVEPWGRSSLYHDLAYGGRLELEALNGEVVRRRREYDIPTPLNVAIYAALKPYINGAPAPQRLATNTAALGAFYPCKTCTRSLTASALSFRSPSSSSLRASSMMSSMPEAPSLTGTPTKRSSIPYSPCR